MFIPYFSVVLKHFSLLECHTESPGSQCLLMPDPLVEPEGSAQTHGDLAVQDMQSMLDVGNLLRLNTGDQMKEEREGKEK